MKEDAAALKHKSGEAAAAVSGKVEDAAHSVKESVDVRLIKHSSTNFKQFSHALLSYFMISIIHFILIAGANNFRKGGTLDPRCLWQRQEGYRWLDWWTGAISSISRITYVNLMCVRSFFYVENNPCQDTLGIFAT